MIAIRHLAEFYLVGTRYIAPADADRYLLVAHPAFDRPPGEAAETQALPPRHQQDQQVEDADRAVDVEVSWLARHCEDADTPAFRTADANQV